jgi:hypothetical protein
MASSSDLTPTNNAVPSSAAPGAELSAAPINSLDTINTPGINAGASDTESDTLTTPTINRADFLEAISDHTDPGQYMPGTPNVEVRSGIWAEGVLAHQMSRMGAVE